jgi:hypothetical protein
MYAVAKGSKTEQTGIGPIDGMRNAFADITGNTRPVSGTQEVSPSTQYSPQRGTLMRDNASEQMMREGGYKPIDFSVQEERSAYDALRSDYDSRRAKSKPPVKPQGQYAPPPVAPQQAPAAAPALGPSEEYLKTLSPTGRAMAKTFVNAAAENGKEFGPDGKIRDYAPQPQGQYGPAPPSEIGSYAQTTSGGSPAFVDSSGKQYPIIKQKIGKSDRTSLTIVKDGKTYVMEQDGNGRWVTAWEIKKSK